MATDDSTDHDVDGRAYGDEDGAVVTATDAGPGPEPGVDDGSRPALGVARLRTLLRDRLSLLRLLDAVPVGPRSLLAAAMLLSSLLPAATAVAVGWLVGEVI